THCEFWAGTRFEFGQSGKGYHFSFAIPYVELPDIFGPGPVVALGLDVDLPLAAKPVEVIHKQSAHKSPDRAIDIVDRHALFDHLIFVHIDELLRNTGKKGRTQAGNLGTFAGSGHEGVQVSRK